MQNQCPSKHKIYIFYFILYFFLIFDSFLSEISFVSVDAATSPCFFYVIRF